MPFATLDTSGKFEAAIAAPIRRMSVEMSRLTSRRRVWAAGESSPLVTISPTRVPRFAITRSISLAITIATAMAMPASIQSRLAAAV